MNSFRLKQMEEFILDSETVTMKQLCSKFGVSMNTVRMDVDRLVKRGNVIKVYGGVRSSQENPVSVLVPFEERKQRNILLKRAIGREAAGYVDNGDIIYLDTGSTTFHMIRHLSEKQGVIILTNSLEAVNSAVQYPGLEVICLPGKLERKTNSFLSSDTAGALGKYNIDKAFMAATGVSDCGGVTNSSLLELEVKQAAVQHCKRKYLLVDSTKFGKAALVNYATLEQMDRVITDEGLKEGDGDMCKRHCTGVDLASLLE